MQPNEIYTIAAANLGRRLTLNSEVPEEVGCAQAVSWILLNAEFPIPKHGISTVNGLIDWMLANGFEEIYAPAAGAVITAHRRPRTDPAYAHAGICLNYGIGSNDSRNGRFTQNYTYESWDNFYGTHGSLTRYFFHK